MAELFGRVDGCAHGRGGSMHLLDVERGYYGGWGIVAGQLPIATGLGARRSCARAARSAVLCELGDGAINMGAWHESLNLAAVWQLPVVFLVMNNEYGMGTSVERASAVPELYRRAAAYGLPASGSTATTCWRSRRRPRRCSRAAREERQPACSSSSPTATAATRSPTPGSPTARAARSTSTCARDPIFRARELLAAEGVADDELDEMLDAVHAPRRRRRSRPRSRARRRRSSTPRERACTRRAAPSSSRGCFPARRSVSASSYSPEGSGSERPPPAAAASDGETMTYREALRLAMREEMLRDERVFVMGEEVGVFEGAYKVTAGLLEEFGADRVRDTPISEEGFVGAGVGAAMIGERPIVEIMTINFMLVAIDQVVNHAAKIGAMFGGEVALPARDPHARRRRQPAHRPALAVASRSGSRPSPASRSSRRRRPRTPRGCSKTAIRDDDPVLVVENLVDLQGARRGAARSRVRHPDRARRRRPRGHAT